LEKVVEAINIIISDSISIAMNRYNRKVNLEL